MTNRSPIRSICQPPARRASEQGYVMLIAIFFMALLVISLAVAAPKIAKSIQRDREVETFHRGMQYRRGIQLYYRKFHAYPPNIDALVNTNNIRFIRKRYKDPLTGQDDWKPVLFGQNKAPTAMGFFGQPLSGGASTIAGTGPGGGMGIPGITSTGSPSGGFGSSDTSSDQSSNNGSSASAGSTDNSGNGSSSGPSGPTFGGAGIIGFEPGVDKASILIYKKKQRYNQWEFTYDPISDMQTIGGGNAGMLGQQGQNSNQNNSNPTFGPSPTNNNTSNPPLPTPGGNMPPETQAPQQ